MTATLTTIASFDDADGASPTSGLLADAAGDLFGTTYAGGPAGDGTVFEVAKTPSGYASTPTMLVSFNSADGANPQSNLIEDAAGDLFGTTNAGGANGTGTVFEIVKTADGYASTPTTLVNFDKLTYNPTVGPVNGTGANPAAGLISDAAGDLFGTGEYGGANASGVVFEIPYVDGSYANSPTILADFSYASGITPLAGLIANSAGDLFGTTFGGGADDGGTVFELVNNGGGSYTLTTLVNFSPNATGLDLNTPLVSDAAGDLFGTAYAGGPSGGGTVFEVPYLNGSYASTPTVLASFNTADGYPLAGLTIDANGDLFGTATGTAGLGGTTQGSVFELVNTGGGYTITTLASFVGTNYELPSGLIANAAGDLFGTTGGGYTLIAVPTVFELSNTGFVVCFLAGSLIATPGGEVPVQRLAAGDKVITLSGEARHIVWIGTGRVLATRGRRSAATPVIVRRGALADNVPHTDLRVTKAHGLYFDGVLIPLEFPVNHRTILWDDDAKEVTIYHIELKTHDVILANGALAESYRDDGNRWLFRNANTGWHLPPQEPCVPVMTGGPLVDTLWRRLLNRAGPRRSLKLTDDADLHLVADGRPVEVHEQTGGIHVFHLPAVPSNLSIASCAATPAELGLARDPRRLGVALRRIQIRQGTCFRTIDASDERLADGFHAFEPAEGYRWTDGLASVPISLFAGFTGPVEVVLNVGGTTRYLEHADRRHVA